MIVERFFPEACPRCLTRFRRWGLDYVPFEFLGDALGDDGQNDSPDRPQGGALHSTLEPISCLACANVTIRLMLRRALLGSSQAAKAAVDSGEFTGWGPAAEVRPSRGPARTFIIVGPKKVVRR